MTALTDVVNNLKASLDNNMISTLVLLDHSKTFDKVDYFILLKKFSASQKQLTDYYVHISQVDLRLYFIMEHILKVLMLIKVSPTGLSAWIPIILLI